MRNMLGCVRNDIVKFRNSFDELQVEKRLENSLPKRKSHKTRFCLPDGGTRPCAKAHNPCAIL